MSKLPDPTPEQIEALVLQSLSDNLDDDIDLGQEDDTLEEELPVNDQKPKLIKRNPRRS